MKTLRLLSVLMLIIGIAACKGACQKGEDAPADDTPTKEEASTPTKASLTPESIADALSKAVCARMVACNAEAGLNEADCAAGMTKDLAQALPEKAKVVAKDTLNGCIAAINKATCDDLNSPRPPKGCDFME
jgi:hypothetical protein